MEHIKVIKSLERMLLVLNQKMLKGYLIDSHKILDEVTTIYRKCEKIFSKDEINLLNITLSDHYNKFSNYCEKKYYINLNSKFIKEIEYMKKGEN